MTDSKIFLKFQKLINALNLVTLKTILKKNSKSEQLNKLNRIISKQEYKKTIDSYNIMTKYAGSNPRWDSRQYKNLYIIGAYYYQNGLTRFSDWSNKMTDEFGDYIKSQVYLLWTDIKNNVKMPNELNLEPNIIEKNIKYKSILTTLQVFSFITGSFLTAFSIFNFSYKLEGYRGRESGYLQIAYYYKEKYIISLSIGIVLIVCGFLLKSFKNSNQKFKHTR